MVDLLQNVVNHGTAAGARSRGFFLPAAGKTGTSHDGWFAGFTSNLLAVAWVGYDDDRELRLTGADSALPIWTEFMKRATQIPAYSDAHGFEAPAGVVAVPVTTTAVLPSGSEAITTHDEYFIEGTEPQGATPAAAGGGVLSRLFHSGDTTGAPAATPAAPQSSAATTAAPAGADAAPAPGDKKGGVLKKFFSIFKGNPPKQDNPPEAPKKTPPQG
jgi:penicillin-binding protein 1B